MAERLVRPIRIEGQVAYVPLTRGYEAIIDAADVPLILGFNWYAHVDRCTIYAQRTMRRDGKILRIQMHRVILDVPDGLHGDHIDGNGINNRRSNLRIATLSQNQHNIRIARNNTSGFKGVSWSKKSGKWQAKIKLNGKNQHLGLFDEIEAAHHAYVCAATTLHGDFSPFARKEPRP